LPDTSRNTRILGRLISFSDYSVPEQNTNHLCPTNRQLNAVKIKLLKYPRREKSQGFSLIKRIILEMVQILISRANGDVERRFQNGGQIIIAGQRALA
jgi:hypothetical protein